MGPSSDPSEAELFNRLESDMTTDTDRSRRRAEELFVRATEDATLTVIALMQHPKPEIQLRAALAILDRSLGRLGSGEGRKLHSDQDIFAFVKNVSVER